MESLAVASHPLQDLNSPGGSVSRPGEFDWPFSSRMLAFWMTAADLPIAIDREVVARFCRERGIRSLSLFGSVLRSDFDPKRSDIDVLAEFVPGALRGVGLRYFAFADELSTILGHRVDFCSQLHPTLRAEVERRAVKLYEQT